MAAGVKDSDRAGRCLQIVDRVKHWMVQGQPWSGAHVRAAIEELETELYWIRGSKEREHGIDAVLRDTREFYDQILRRAVRGSEQSAEARDVLALARLLAVALEEIRRA